MTFNNHSGWKLLKACRKCIFSEYLYTLHVCKHLFWVLQGVFLVWQVLLMWRWKKGRKKRSDEQYVYMNWLKLDNFKQSLFCKKTKLHLTPVCSGLVLQADQQAPKGCHQLQGMWSCSDFHAGTLFALLQMKPCSLEPRFNRANKWNHSTSCSPQHITFRESNQSWRKWKNKM